MLDILKDKEEGSVYHKIMVHTKGDWFLANHRIQQWNRSNNYTGLKGSHFKDISDESIL